jgi:HSP20 family protein
MAITRWEPFHELERWEPLAWEPIREIERMQRQMNRMMERLFPGDGGRGALAYVPSAELEETDKEILLKLEIPGMEAKDLDIEVEEGSVTIRGERKTETKTEEKGLVRSEFHYGKFERVIPLPTRVQHENVKAEYKNGILSLTLPKTEEEQRKVVKVNIE